MSHKKRCKCCMELTPDISLRIDGDVGAVCESCYLDLIKANKVLREAGLDSPLSQLTQNLDTTNENT